MSRTLRWLLIACASLCGDELHLKNGAVLYGTVAARDDDGLWLEVAGSGRIKVSNDELLRVVIHDDGGLREASELVRVGAWQTAVERISAGLRVTQEQPALRALLARAYLGWIRRLQALDQPYRAEEVLEAALLQCPQATAELAVLAESLSRRLDLLDDWEASALRWQHAGDFAAARQSYLALVEAAPAVLDEVADDLAFCEAKLGDAALAEGRWQDAVGHFTCALERVPALSSSLAERLVYAWGQEIRSLILSGAYAPARRQVERLRREFPSSQVGVYLEASLTLSEGNVPRAVELYRRLFARGDPVRGSSDPAALEKAADALVAELLGIPIGGQQRRFSETTSRAFEVHQSAHFSIRHKNLRVVGEVAEALEAAHSRVSAFFSLEPFSEKIEVVLHPDVASYRETGAGEGYGGLDSVCCRGARVHPRRIELLQSAPQLLECVIPHEVAHVLWRDAVHGSDTPLWLNEGVAGLFEPTTRHVYLADIFARRVCRCEKPTLLDLIGWRVYPARVHDAEDLYAYAYVAVAQLAEDGEPADLLMLGRMMVNDLPLQFALHRLYGYPRLADLEQAIILRAGR